MKYELMKLPYALDALEPLMSKETLEYHYGKHHQTYVNNLNNLIAGTEYENKTLEDIICSSDGGLFNNAAQVFNHDFFWKGLTPQSTTISRELEEALKNEFGSVDEFKKEFTNKALTHFASGWVWLIKNNNGRLSVISTPNASTPITEEGYIPLLTCDVWEHAYYIDTRNSRPQYLENFWKMVNWDFVNENFNS